MVMKLMPSLPKQKNAYVEYIQTRNSIIVIIILSLLLTFLLTLFTILYNTLYPNPDNWFMWPLWIFYAIAISIGFSKSLDLYRKYRALSEELGPQEKNPTSTSSPLHPVDSTSNLTSNDSQQQQQQQLQQQNTATSFIGNEEIASPDTFTAEKLNRGLLTDDRV